MKKFVRLFGVAATLYYAMEWAYNKGMRDYYEKLKAKAEKHPEMTLAQLVFEGED